METIATRIWLMYGLTAISTLSAVFAHSCYLAGIHSDNAVIKVVAILAASFLMMFCISSAISAIYVMVARGVGEDN